VRDVQADLVQPRRPAQDLLDRRVCERPRLLHLRQELGRGGFDALRLCEVDVIPLLHAAHRALARILIGVTAQQIVEQAFAHGAVGHLHRFDAELFEDPQDRDALSRRKLRSSVTEQLGIESMKVADGAMREGLLYDLLGRYTDEDARERTVRSMQERYHVDLAQAERVEATAAEFLSQVEEAWSLADPAIEQILRWAARLHEIGLDVAHSGYHRHGAYLLAKRRHGGIPARGTEAYWRSWLAVTGASPPSKRRMILRLRGTSARRR